MGYQLPPTLPPALVMAALTSDAERFTLSVRHSITKPVPPWPYASYVICSIGAGKELAARSQARFPKTSVAAAGAGAPLFSRLPSHPAWPIDAMRAALHCHRCLPCAAHLGIVCLGLGGPLDVALNDVGGHLHARFRH